jgi:ABC-type sugar transport system substrate-binding protein
MKLHTHLIVIVTALLFSTFVLAADNLRVTFINPGFADADNPTGIFWSSVSASMQAAAEDLAIDLEIIYSDRNHIKTQRLAQQVISRENPPDYLLVVNEKLSAENIVKEAEKAGVNVFVMLNRFEGEQHNRMGSPRDKYKHWFGSLVPDNRYAGYLSAKLLIEQALKAGVQADDGKLHLLGYAGDNVTQASVERVAGLKQAVLEYPDVVLKQVIRCDWSKDKSKRKMLTMLRRYPHIGAIWAANDPIALGAMEGAQISGKVPGKDILFSGINWNYPALQKITKGEMVTSLGGHFMAGAWALVMIYDYHHGNDFANGDTDQEKRFQYKMFTAIDKQNIEPFLNKFTELDWGKIDFRKFSKVLNPRISTYNFNFETVLPL